MLPGALKKNRYHSPEETIVGEPIRKSTSNGGESRVDDEKRCTAERIGDVGGNLAPAIKGEAGGGG